MTSDPIPIDPTRDYWMSAFVYSPDGGVPARPFVQLFDGDGKALTSLGFLPSWGFPEDSPSQWTEFTRTISLWSSAHLAATHAKLFFPLHLNATSTTRTTILLDDVYFGTFTDTDPDRDGVEIGEDNCPGRYNPDQQDTDGDGVGDACNWGIDTDHDDWADSLDNCPFHRNRDQLDSDGDGVGDACSDNLSLKDIEITQVVQRLGSDPETMVPLVEGKATWVRVYLDVGGAVDPIPQVWGRLYPTDASGDPVPDMGFVDSYPNPITAWESKRGDWKSSLNFYIPYQWQSSSSPLSFKVVVNPNQEVFETDYSDNEFGPYEIPFHSRDPLSVVFVPVGIKFAPDDDEYCTHDLDRFLHHAYRTEKVFPVKYIDVWRTVGAHKFDGDLTKDEGRSQLLTDIWWMNQRTDDPKPNMKWYGLVCGDFGGRGYRPGNEAWGEGGWTGGWSIMSHEIGHNFGRKHAPCGDPPGADEGYPDYPDYDSGSIGEFGLTTGRVYRGDDSLATVRDPSIYYDFMTYCGPEWVSPYTYEALFDQFEPDIAHVSQAGSGLEPTQTDHLALTGILRANGTGYIRRAHTVALASDPEPGESGNYSIELRDAVGALLLRHRFDPVEVHGLEETFPFFARLEYPNGTAEVLLKHGDVLLDTVHASPNAPRVTLLSPNGGEFLDDESVITWNATDSDGDSLTYDLLYSRDAGEQWFALAVGLTDTSFTWNAPEAGGSDTALVRVIANDGLKSAWDDSDGTFRIAKQTPKATISSPLDGETVVRGEPLILSGRALDPEEGNLDGASLTWSSDIQGDLGTGREFFVAQLVRGNHTISLTALDSDGNLATASVTIRVLNAPPKVEVGFDRLIPEGSILRLLTARLRDLDTTDTHTATVAWGDGVVTEAILAGEEGDRRVTANHSYVDDGTYRVQLTGCDNQGACASDHLNIAVQNSPPKIHDLAATIEGRTATISAYLLDPGLLDRQLAFVDWGDGTPPVSIPMAQGAGTASVTGHHVYESDGDYRVLLLALDEDGGFSKTVVTVQVRFFPYGIVDIFPYGIVGVLGAAVAVASLAFYALGRRSIRRIQNEGLQGSRTQGPSTRTGPCSTPVG